MLKKIIGFASLLAIFATVSISTSARADYVYCEQSTYQCYTVIESPAVDPAVAPDPDTGFTPGAPQCLFSKLFPDGTEKNIETPCSTVPGNYWSNANQCYWSLDNPQLPPPAQADKSGAWYFCDPHPECGNSGSLNRNCYSTTKWLINPPPGINRLTPGQAAARLISSFKLEGIHIGLAPDTSSVDSSGYVGVPIWMWVKDPTPLSYGPYTASATLGGITIHATATVHSILWDMGDGNTVACSGPGTSYQVGFGIIDSPNCGYRYSKISNDRYNITATSQWSVDWTANGETGTVPLKTTSNTSLKIRELQAVNVS